MKRNRHANALALRKAGLAKRQLLPGGCRICRQHIAPRRNMMFQRISSLILLFCLTAALLPHGNAAAANQKPEYFANSDALPLRRLIRYRSRGRCTTSAKTAPARRPPGTLTGFLWGTDPAEIHEHRCDSCPGCNNLGSRDGAPIQPRRHFFSLFADFSPKSWSACGFLCKLRCIKIR